MKGTNRRRTRVLLTAAAAFALSGCEAGPTVAANDPPPAKQEAVVAELPYAQGKSFPDLDSYLKHLEKLSAMDIPYYKRRDDGTYVYIAGRIRPGPDDVYTRAQLLERFGFSE